MFFVDPSLSHRSALAAKYECAKATLSKQATDLEQLQVRAIGGFATLAHGHASEHVVWFKLPWLDV